MKLLPEWQCHIGRRSGVQTPGSNLLFAPQGLEVNVQLINEEMLYMREEHF